MKLQKIEGIVVSETNYSESSKILNILTKEYGLISAISKGCRKIKSNLRSVSSKLTYGYFHLNYKENGLSNLIAVDVINNYRNVIYNLTNISYASYMMELTTQVVKQNGDKNIYELFISALNKVNEGLDPNVITSILEIKYLEYLGVKPSIDECALCGSTKNIITLDSNQGGYICSNCYTNQLKASDKTIKLVRMFYYVDINKITKLDISDETMKEINSFIDQYYEDYTGIYLNSKRFLKNLNKL